MSKMDHGLPVIEDWQISASSHRFSEDHCQEKYARIFSPDGYAWCPQEPSDAEWIQIDLGSLSKVNGILTQGRTGSGEYVTLFRLSYSMDALHWQYVSDSAGNQREIPSFKSFWLYGINKLFGFVNLDLILYALFLFLCECSLIIIDLNQTAAERWNVHWLSLIPQSCVLILSMIANALLYFKHDYIQFLPLLLMILVNIVICIKMIFLITYQMNYKNNRLIKMNLAQIVRNLMTNWIVLKDYCKEYPAISRKFDFLFICRCIIEILTITSFISSFSKFFLHPLVAAVRFSSFPYIVYLITVILKFSGLVWVLFLALFYLVYQSICGMSVSLTKCPKARPFEDWWNCSTLSEFWRTWNLSVHEFMIKIYIGLMQSSLKLSSIQSLTCTFIFSGVLHELALILLFKWDSKHAFTFSFFIQGLFDHLFVWLTKRSQVAFVGNFNDHQLRYNYFDVPLLTRFIKIHTTKWINYPSLRFEIIGSQACRYPLGLPPFGKISSNENEELTCRAADAFTFASAGWCPRSQFDQSWIQADLGYPSPLSAIATKGKEDSESFWVTQYKVSYSNDSVHWQFFHTEGHSNIKIFEGNVDKFSERIHFLNRQLVTRYIRFHPIKWNNRPGMRIGIYGCPHTGKCDKGYFRLNEGSTCVENVAFGKPKWTLTRKKLISRKRRTSKKNNLFAKIRWIPGLKLDFESCLIGLKDTNKQRWLIDLGIIRRVSGAIIEEKRIATIVDRHVIHEKYAIFVDVVPYTKQFGQQLCATYRVDDQTDIFSNNTHVQLHFQCRIPVWGRYLFIQRQSTSQNYSNLCDLRVYE
ncbi:hypothetical protein GJ496_011664 [Pomphorhynchus laevis]|nr:hypothetical protein GJ496_011664 [Pomphorhynchus laevis]